MVYAISNGLRKYLKGYATRDSSFPFHCTTFFVSVIGFFIVNPYFIDIEDIPILIIEENTDVSIKLINCKKKNNYKKKLKNLRKKWRISVAGVFH